MITHKSALTLFRQVFQTFNFHFSIQKLHTSFQKFNSDFIFGVMQKDVQLILMHNTLQV